MQDERGEDVTMRDDAQAAPEPARGAKSKHADGQKPHRSHTEQAMAKLRAAKRGQREVSDPAERARLLLAEANVLALLDVADALGGGAADEGGARSRAQHSD